jgi:hypothetical protein
LDTTNSIERLIFRRILFSINNTVLEIFFAALVHLVQNRTKAFYHDDDDDDDDDGDDDDD